MLPPNFNFSDLFPLSAYQKYVEYGNINRLISVG